MRTEYLNEFIELSKTENYSLAADTLFVSQPSLTRHIQELERDAGTELFVRTPKGIHLNEAGKIFLRFANQMLDLENDYHNEIAAYIQRLNGSLEIGSVFAMKQYHITEMMAGWHQLHPEISVHIVEQDSTDLLSLLRQDKIQMAFLRDDFPEENADFDKIPIALDRMVCLFPEGHPLAGRQTVTIAELKNERFVYYEKCPLTNMLFLGAGYVPSEGVGLRGRNALALVRQKSGIMLEFQKQIDPSEFGGFSVVEIAPSIQSRISLYYHSRTLSESGKRFVNFIREQASPQ